ncbi:MAG TPA: DUF4282 domain-containing protein [Gallionella sp.]|nr:DUF4282 domain-containing protein [Gallionella sp.]
MKDVLFFENMLTPKIITFVYWLLLLAAVIGGLGSMFGFGGFSFAKFFMGMIYVIGGAIAARIWCELLIVLFKMNEALQELRHK